MQKLLAALAAAQPLLWDLVGLCGCACIVLGVDEFNRGAALIVAGLLCLTTAVLHARKSA